MAARIRHICAKRWLLVRIRPPESDDEMPSVVDSNVDWSSEIVWVSSASASCRSLTSWMIE